MTLVHQGIPYFYFPFANVWFFKRMWPFRKWARYNELTSDEWQAILQMLKHHRIVPIVAITATWVEQDGTLTPFPDKFPEEAAILKDAADKGDIFIANHGLTHCVIGKHLPSFWHSNREFHREFYPKFDQSYHTEHIQKSQKILEEFFARPVEILVPPGNIWSIKTYYAMQGTNLKKVICNQYMQDSNEKLTDIQFIHDGENMFYFHDMELKRYGLTWLNKQIVNFYG